MQKFLDESGVGRLPVELEAGPGCPGALVEKEHVGEVLTKTRSGLVVGARDGARCADHDGGGLGEFGDRRLEPVADHVGAACRVMFQHTPKEVSQIGDVDGRPVLLAGSQHDQVAGGVAG